MDSMLDDPALAMYRLVSRPDALAREGLFAVEGRLVLPRLLASRYRVHSVLVSEAARDALSPLLAQYPDVNAITAPAETISEVAGFDFHRGCIALGYREFIPVDFSRLVGSTRDQPGKINRDEFAALVLENVSNPDNIGGIFRSAHAFGARAVLLGPGCGDPLYRKAIRTSMGATLDVPWSQLEHWPGDLRALESHGVTLIALTPGPSAPPLRDVLAASSKPIAFLLGSEGFGLSTDAMSLARPARIPMPNATADSLNVAAAASIALYEASSVR